MHPQPLFEIFGQGVYAYGICMAVGLIACFGFLILAMWIKNFNDDAQTKIVVIGICGTGFGIFTAMLFQSIYNYIADPSGGFHLAGMTFIGGLIGGVSSFLIVWWLYVYVVAPRTKIKLLQNNMNAGLTDALPFIPIGITIAHAFGRLGCFFGGCCYGVAAEELGEHVWGLPCSAPHGIQLDTLVVPTQLYECIFLFALSGLMALLYFRFKFNYNFGFYLIAYGVWRFFIEFLRNDTRGELISGLPLYPSQIWSLLMPFLGVGLIVLQRYVFSRTMQHPEKSTKMTVQP